MTRQPWKVTIFVVQSTQNMSRIENDKDKIGRMSGEVKEREKKIEEPAPSDLEESRKPSLQHEEHKRKTPHMHATVQCTNHQCHLPNHNK